MSARPGIAALVGALAVATAGCSGSFEDPAIVLDLRVLAVAATPPEQVVDLDITSLPDTPEEFEALGLVDLEICALVADPGEVRTLAWEMTACARTPSDRCDDPERPAFPFARGQLDDPERAPTAQVACGTMPVDAGILLLIQDAIENDPLLGFGQIDLQIDLKVTPAGAPDVSIHASKRVRFAARLPAERTANTNPTLARIDVDRTDGDAAEPLQLGRCANLIAPLQVGPGDRVHLEPIEPDGVREVYVVPTFDGGSRTFTETMRYQWLATDGEWTRANTGGPRDASGALPTLDSTWIAPAVDVATDVTLWLVQRDERLGQDWFQSCVRVVP